MATHLKSKSFQKNLFLSVAAIFILFVLSFSFYQYRREKEYKIDIMHSRMQMYSFEMAQTLGDSLYSHNAFQNYVKTHNVEGLRVTLIDLNGKVLLDSEQKDVRKMANHLKREEVKEALRSGNGYDIKRASASTKQTYFYSATKIGDVIIRAAVPYNAELTKSLQADNSYLFYALIVTILLSIVLYRNTSRIGRHIDYLRQFAMKAEEGQELDHELEMKLPDDELGEISHHIITLYWKLRHSEEDKVRIKRQLTQNAAHELKTPAASIHGYLETILLHPEIDEEKKMHFLERCYAQSDRMSKLLLDMSALTKLDEMDTQEFQKKETILNINNIIHCVLEDSEFELKEKNITPVLHLPDKILIRGDQSLVCSIFQNLTDNAVAYAIGATKITISAMEEDTKYDFTFSDNGQGVEPQHLAHLFERFYRVDKGRSRKLGGTGLGLAIVKNAVAAHGGTATAELTSGGGLTIRFTLMK